MELYSSFEPFSYEYYNSSNTLNIELVELDWFKVITMVCVFRFLGEPDEFSLAFVTGNKSQIRFY